MKKTIEVECCDICQAHGLVRSCIHCGKALCFEHGETQAVTYSHGVYAGGHGDGFYCKPCDTLLTNSGADPLHNAYLAVESLKHESAWWQEGFAKRRKAVEAHLESLYENRFPRAGVSDVKGESH